MNMGRGFGSYIRTADRDFILAIKECMYCGSKNNLSIDHILPLKKGGDSKRSNLTRACNRCNSRKTDFTMDQFLDRSLDNRTICERKVKNYLKGYTINKKGKNTDKMIYYYHKFLDAREQFSYYHRIIISIKNEGYKI